MGIMFGDYNARQFHKSGVLSGSQAVHDYQAERHLLSPLQCEARDNVGSTIDGQLLQQKHKIKARWYSRTLRMPRSSDSYPLARRLPGASAPADRESQARLVADANLWAEIAELRALVAARRRREPERNGRAEAKQPEVEALIA
jgi:hypothetical protein